MLKKIKKMDRRGNFNPKTEKQIEASISSGTKVMLLNNPMKRQEVRNKVSKKLKGRITTPQNLFKVGNKFRRKTPLSQKEIEKIRLIGIKNKGKKHSEETKLKLSLAKLTKPQNNSMKNKAVAKKNAFARSLNSTIPKNIFEWAVEEFKDGRTLQDIAKDLKVDRARLGKAFRRAGIDYDSNERRRIASLNNPNVKKSWFKQKAERREK